MTNTGPRSTLLRVVAERGESLAALSAMIGRNAAYLHQFVTRGSPRRLAEHDRRLLADYLNISEQALGAADKPGPVRITRLDISASAGPGAIAEYDVVQATEMMDPALARSLRLDPARSHIVAVRGDSMAPMLMEGDQIYIDTRDRVPPAGGGVFVIRVDGLMMVKRVAKVAGGIAIASDNPHAPPVAGGPIEIIGRVVWQTRRLR